MVFNEDRKTERAMVTFKVHHSLAQKFDNIKIGSKMSKRTIARRVFITIGVVELLLFAVTGLTNSTAGVSGIMFLFIGATNFCSQCPLLSAFKRMFNRSKWNKIPTHKL